MEVRIVRFPVVFQLDHQIIILDQRPDRQITVQTCFLVTVKYDVRGNLVTARQSL